MLELWIPGRELMSEEKVFMDTMEYILGAPVVETPIQPFPSNMREHVTTWRLLEGSKCFEENMCTGYEALGYLSCMSLQAPLTSNITDAMHHLFNKYYPDLAFGDDDPRVTTLNADSSRELLELRRTLFRVQQRTVKENRKKKIGQAKEVLKKVKFTLEDFHAD